MPQKWGWQMPGWHIYYHPLAAQLSSLDQLSSVEKGLWIMKTPCFVIAEFPTSSSSFILTQPSSFVFNSPPRWRQHQRRLKTANKSKPATSPPPPVWNILSEFSFFIPWYLSNPWNTRFPSPIISIYGLRFKRAQKRWENLPDTVFDLVCLLCRIFKLQDYWLQQN